MDALYGKHKGFQDKRHITAIFFDSEKTYDKVSIYLYTLAVSPSLGKGGGGGLPTTQKNNKNNGVFTPFF